MTVTSTVGVVSGGTPTGRAIVQAVRELGHRAKIIHPGELSFEMDSDEIQVTPQADIYLNWASNGRDARSLELHGILKCLEETEDVVNDADSWMNAANKGLTQAVLSGGEKSTPIIESAYGMSNKAIDEVRNQRGGTGVIKPTFGGGGGGVQMSDNGVIYAGGDVGVLQRFVETPDPEEVHIHEDLCDATDGHHDVRAFVVGDEVVAAMNRVSTDDCPNWTTNITQGGAAHPAMLDPDDLDLAVDATHSLGLEIAGVDLIYDAETDTTRVIELNAPAGSKGLTDATGVNPAVPIAKHMIRRAGSEVRETIDTFEYPDKGDFRGNTGKYGLLTANEMVTFAGESERLSQPIGIDQSLDNAIITMDLATALGAKLITHNEEPGVKVWCHVDETTWRQAFVIVEDVNEYTNVNTTGKRGVPTQAVFASEAVPGGFLGPDFPELEDGMYLGTRDHNSEGQEFSQTTELDET